MIVTVVKTNKNTATYGNAVKCIYIAVDNKLYVDTERESMIINDVHTYVLTADNGTELLKASGLKEFKDDID